MKEKTNTATINKLIYISVLTLIICLIFVVSKYIGLAIFIKKVIKAFVPVFISVFVSFLVEPFINVFIKRNIKRKYSVLLAYFLLLLIVGLILLFTIPSFIEQVEVFVSSIPSLIKLIESFTDGLGVNLGFSVSNSLNGIFSNLSESIINFLGSFVSIAYDTLLGLSGAVFLSFEFPIFKEKCKGYIPKRINAPVVFYFQNFLPFIHKYFFGMLLDTVIIFFISVIGFFVIDIDYILVISFFIAITNLIPIIGPYIGGIPAVLVGFSVSTNLGVSALVVVIIVQLIESVLLQPIILKNTISLHPLEGILGISLFGSFFGVIGMILSPILIVAIKLLFLPYENNKNNIKSK